MYPVQDEAIETLAKLPRHVIETNSLIGLKNIHSKKINLAIHKRKVNEKLWQFTSNLNIDKFPTLHISGYYYDCAKLLKKSLMKVSDDKEGLEVFKEDLISIVEAFSKITGKEFIFFNLYTVDNDMCKYFHSDSNNLRLLCTYRGEGTQWLENANANREKMGSGKNELIVKNEHSIHQLEPYWVAILKGDAYPGNEGNGIIHRSPPMGSNSSKRILLKLDA